MTHVVDHFVCVLSIIHKLYLHFKVLYFFSMSNFFTIGTYTIHERSSFLFL
jgi:hypothetical protein